MSPRPSPWVLSLLPLCLLACSEGASAPLAASQESPVSALYPRPDAARPAFTPTPEPSPIPQTGTPVALWDVPGPLSKDGAAVRLALATVGIPSQVVTGAAELPGAAVAIITGELTDGNVSAQDAAYIEAALRGGTAILLVAPSSPRLYDLAGIAAGRFATTRRGLSLGDLPDGATAELRALGRTRIALAGDGADLLSRGYDVAPDVTTLARFDDGKAALLRRGRLYVLGLRAQYYPNLLGGLKHHLGGPWTSRHYIEGDLIPLLLRGFYRDHAPRPQLRSPAPGGHRAAVILTHDTDSSRTFEIIPQLLELERRFAVKGTFLVPTMPYENPAVGPVYTAALLPVLRQVLREGNEVGSHSFGHFPDFATLPDSLGDESVATYLPVSRQGLTSGGSHLGELQISRLLLETDVGASVEAFRPGYLAFYEGLYGDLRTAGYRRSSSRAVGVVRTNFPYRALRAVSGGYETYPVLEYPLAISDQEMTEENYRQKVADWLAVVDGNLVTGAPTVLLLHATTRASKLEALQLFLEQLATRDVWIGDLRSFAAFYEGQGF